MRKDGGEIGEKRDDDSAIGDSENNSAGEESSASRRKSSISDDADEDPVSRMNVKHGIKMPECLQKSSDSCKSCLNSQPLENEHKMESKLQYLLVEMKQLRELDRDILRNFARINDNVDEMKWLMEKRVADLQNILEDEMEEQTPEEAQSRQSSAIADVSVVTLPEDGEVMKDDDAYIVPVTVKTPTAYATLAAISKHSVSSQSTNATTTTIARPTSASTDTSSPSFSYVSRKTKIETPTASSKNVSSGPPPNSYQNPTYVEIDVAQQTTAMTPPTAMPAQKTRENVWVMNPVAFRKPERPVSARHKPPPVVSSKPNTSRQPSKLTSSLSFSHAPRSGRDAMVRNTTSSSQIAAVVDSAPTATNSGLVKRYSSQLLQKHNQKTARPQPRQTTNGHIAISNGVVGERISEFQRRREYQDLMSLSRVRAAGVQFDGTDLPPSSSSPRPMSPPWSRAMSPHVASSVGGARNSLSRSNTTAALSGGGSNQSSPAASGRVTITRSASNKWIRFGRGKSTKSSPKQTELSRAARPPALPSTPPTENNNRKSVAAYRRACSGETSQQQNSREQFASNDADENGSFKPIPNDDVSAWEQAQDDITYL